MEIIFNIPVIVKVFISLLAILLISRLIKNLIFAITTGTLVLSLLSGHAFETILQIVWNRISSLNFIFLIVIIFLVIGFSTQMSKTGSMKSLARIFQMMASTRTSIAALPAIIGLLPMPGGALFSAPLIDDCDNLKEIKPELKTKINYWFRHIWEYWWPLYPGVLLAIEITGLHIWQFIILQLPLSIFSFFTGYIFFLSKIINKRKKRIQRTKDMGMQLISSMWPIAFVIFFYSIIRLFFPVIFNWNKFLPMSFGIIGAMLILQIKKPLDITSWKEILINKKSLYLAVLVGIVRIYGAFIETRLPDGIFLIDKMKMELDIIGIPLIAIIVIIPFISGIVSGLAIGFVGASFPIVINFLGVNPPIGKVLQVVLLAYTSGYMGMMLSPVHVCFIVTNEYFKTKIMHSLSGLVIPALFMLLCSLCYFLTIRYFFS